MKRIVGGRTFNTETATVIFHREQWQPWSGHEDEERTDEHGYLDSETLYRSREGDFFLLDTSFEATFMDGVPIGASPFKRLRPFTPEQALHWLKQQGATTEQIRQQFGDHLKKMNKQGTVYLRIPQSLKVRLERCATERGVSLNTWIMRWLEQAAFVEEQGGGELIHRDFRRTGDQ